MTAGTPELERTLVHHLSRIRFEDLPDASVEAARRCALDAVAVCAAGSTGTDIDKLVQWRGAGWLEAGVLVYGTRLPAHHATWINSAMARAHEFDDSHDPTGDHTSVPIFSAALAAARLCAGVSGREFLTAYVLAADLVSRLRLAPNRKVGVTDFAANTYAPFAAATAAGWLLGLRDDGLYAALGWAPAQAAGSLQLQQGGTSTLHVHHGLAPRGVQGALLARRATRDMEHFLTGSFGFLSRLRAGRLRGRHDHRRAREQHAKFSLFYTVACALARGHVDLSDFTPSALADEVVQRLAARVRVEVDPQPRAGYSAGDRARSAARRPRARHAG